MGAQLDKLSAVTDVGARGILLVIFHVASGHLYKKTLEKDDAPKGVFIREA